MHANLESYPYSVHLLNARDQQYAKNIDLQHIWTCALKKLDYTLYSIKNR